MRRLGFVASLFVAILFASLAQAFTQAQYTAIKTMIQSDAGNLSRSDTEIATWANEVATPAFSVWKLAMTPEDMREALVTGAIQLDNLTAGKRDTLLFLAQGNINPSLAATRQAIDDLCGTQSTLKTALQSAEKRTATRAEKALATGTGTSVSPGSLGWEGTLSTQDVIDALTRG